MTDIELTQEHDLLIVNRDIVLFTTLPELTAQKLKIRLLNYRGEWFRDINTGVPYLQQIMGVRGTKALADTILKTVIAETENVGSILSYSSVINQQRHLIVTFSASLVSGGKIENLTVEI